MKINAGIMAIPRPIKQPRLNDCNNFTPNFRFNSIL